ncbi:MAG: TolC family protein [Proteobacteria bacterium]|nr:TolC family protein [Pseudomonadota bacterium]
MKSKLTGAAAVLLAIAIALPTTPRAEQVGPASPADTVANSYDLPNIDPDNPPEIPPGPPMTLKEALEAADKNNNRLDSVRLEVDKVEGRLAQAYAFVIPMVSGSLDLMHQDHSDKVSFGAAPGMPGDEFIIRPQDALTGAITIGMTVIHPEGWARISALTKGTDFARLSVEDARQEILVLVAQAYYLALMAKSLIELRVELLKAAAHHLKVATARFNAGTGLRIDVIRAETDQEQARQELLTAHLALDNTRDTLAYLTRVEGMPLPVGAPVIIGPTGNDEDLVRQAEANHPDINAQSANVDMQERQLTAAWMKFVPMLEAGWVMNYTFTEISALASQERARWFLSFSLKVPLYSHASVGAVKQSKADYQQSLIDLRDARENASVEVRKARRDYLTAISSATIADNQANLAKEALSLTKAAYNAGTGSSLDVTDAQQTASSAAVNLVSKHLEAQIALIKLLRSIGDDILTYPNIDSTQYYASPYEVLRDAN